MEKTIKRGDLVEVSIIGKKDAYGHHDDETSRLIRQQILNASFTVEAAALKKDGFYTCILKPILKDKRILKVDIINFSSVKLEKL